MDSYSDIQGLREQIKANAECLVMKKHELIIVIVGDIGLPDYSEAQYRAKILRSTISKEVLLTGKVSTTPAGALKRLLCQTCEMLDSDVKLDAEYDAI